MAFGKTREQKAAEAAERARIDFEGSVAFDAQRARAAEITSPVTQAIEAKAQRQSFFEVQLEVGTSQRAVSFGTADFSTDSTAETYGAMIGEIEAVGWRLEHAGYVFVVTGESSRDKLMSSGQATAVSGKTVGIYLFRNMNSVLATVE